MNYTISGNDLPYVTCQLQAGETIQSEGGGMCWMSPNMRMETRGGGLGKALGRMFSGETVFLNYYTAMNGPGMIAFASSFPGSIRALEIGPGQEFIIQKGSYLASETGVELSVHFRKNIGAGLFGGEGFIMQRLSGQGVAFLEIDGSAVDIDLRPGEQMIVDTGYLAAMSASCQMDIQSVPGIKNALFGGEGLFNTVITGPGHVILQSQPISNLVSQIVPFVSK